MRSMTRVEAIPFNAMKAGLPWDWVTYPEFLDSLDRTPKSVNLRPFMPVGPLLVWVLGIERAKAGRDADRCRARRDAPSAARGDGRTAPAAGRRSVWSRAAA